MFRHRRRRYRRTHSLCLFIIHSTPRPREKSLFGGDSSWPAVWRKLTRPDGWPSADTDLCLLSEQRGQKHRTAFLLRSTLICTQAWDLSQLCKRDKQQQIQCNISSGGSSTGTFCRDHTQKWETQWVRRLNPLCNHAVLCWLFVCRFTHEDLQVLLKSTARVGGDNRACSG